MVPIAHDAEAFQLPALRIDPALGVGAALVAEGHDRRLVTACAGEHGLGLLLLAVLLLDLPFDRQAVAVPAGHVRRIAAQKVLGAADHVLEDVVQRMAHVDVAVGIGRAIVEDELLPAPASGAQRVIEPDLLPARGNARLLLGEAGLHGEIGLRQEDSVPVIALRGFFRHIARGLSGRAGFAQFVLAEGVSREDAKMFHPAAGRPCLLEPTFD